MWVSQRRASDANVLSTIVQRWHSMVVSIKKWCHTLFHQLDAVAPRRGHAVVYSFPDFEDQGLAVSAELVRRRVRVVYIVSKRASRHTGMARQLRSVGVHIVGKRTVRGAIAYLTATYVFHTHGMFGNPEPPTGKTIVNLWHGMPIKKIRADMGKPGIPGIPPLATSELFRPFLSSAFCVDEELVWVVGLPRNDRLLQHGTKPSAPSQPQKVLWLPTYRSSPLTSITNDGPESGSPVHIPDADIEKLETLFDDLGWHCTIKLHPMATRHSPQALPHVDLIDDMVLMARGQSLYQLMASADVLVTDISSAWFDFLLLDRPIVFTMADRDHYAAGRGVYGSIDLVDQAGAFTTSLDELSTVLRQLAHGPRSVEGPAARDMPQGARLRR
jgi:CDP-glycerol glycerophosphotransferase